MKLKELSIGVSRTFNLGNFESLRVEGGASASVDEGDDEIIVHAKLVEYARNGAAAAYRAARGKEIKGE